MALVRIRHIPKLIHKLGDGEYRIKVKDNRIVIFSKNSRYENEEIKKFLMKLEKMKKMSLKNSSFFSICQEFFKKFLEFHLLFL